MPKAKTIEAEYLTSEQLAILAKVAKSPFAFAKFVFLIHPMRGKTIFDLYDYQKATLWHFLRYNFNIILKFRQAGVTELIAMFCLWLAMYHPYKNIVIISIKDRVAKRVLRKIKFMYRNVPEWLRTRVVNGKAGEFGTADEMIFANGSVISSIPTTDNAGRSEAVSLMVIDEAAIVRWADQIWAAAWPTLSTGGRAIINSTPYGVGNLFHKLYVDAVANANQLNPIRLHWQMHPERGMDWYKQMREVLGPRKTAQEIDGDFLASGNTVFDLADIKDIEDYLEEEENQPIQIKKNGSLLIFEHPKPGVDYFIGADVATGRANDTSTFSVMDREGDEKACFKMKIPIDQFETILTNMGFTYNTALLAPESNDVGLGLATNLQTHGYPNLYYSKHLLKKKGEAKPRQEDIPGWYTTKKNRPVIIAGLEEDIRNNTCNIRNRFLCQEAPTFIYDARNRPVALNKDTNAMEDVLDDRVYNDDAIFGAAITNQIRKQFGKKHLIMPT